MKWRNKPAIYNDEYFRSQFEMNVAKRFDALGIPYEHEKHRLVYDKPTEYLPDFKVGNIYIEAKGFLDARSRSLLIAVKESNPDVEICILFQKADRLLSKAKKALTYGQWASRHGFRWAEGTKIPSLWLKLSGVFDSDPDVLEGLEATLDDGD